MSFYLLIYFGDQLFKCCHTKDLISWGTKAELVIEYALYIRLLLISDASVSRILQIISGGDLSATQE